MKTLILNQDTLALPVIDGLTGDLLGDTSIPIFLRQPLTLAFLVVQSEAENPKSAQRLVRFSDILYLRPSHVAVRSAENDHPCSDPLSPEQYTELIGMPVRMEDEMVQGEVLSVELHGETGAVRTLTVLWEGDEKVVCREEIAAVTSAVVLRAARQDPPIPTPRDPSRLWSGAPEPTPPRSADAFFDLEESRPEQREDIPALLNAIQQKLTDITTFLSMDKRATWDSMAAPSAPPPGDTLPDSPPVPRNAVAEPAASTPWQDVPAEPKPEPPTEAERSFFSRQEPAAPEAALWASYHPHAPKLEVQQEPPAVSTPEVPDPILEALHTTSKAPDPEPKVISPIAPEKPEPAAAPYSTIQCPFSESGLALELTQRLGNIESLLAGIARGGNVTAETAGREPKPDQIPPRTDAFSYTDGAAPSQSAKQADAAFSEPKDPFILREPEIPGAAGAGTRGTGAGEKIHLSDPPNPFVAQPSPPTTARATVPPPSARQPQQQAAPPLTTRRSAGVFWKASAVHCLGMCLFLGIYIALTVFHIL